MKAFGIVVVVIGTVLHNPLGQHLYYTESGAGQLRRFDLENKSLPSSFVQDSNFILTGLNRPAGIFTRGTYDRSHEIAVAASPDSANSVHHSIYTWSNTADLASKAWRGEAFAHGSAKVLKARLPGPSGTEVARSVLLTSSKAVIMAIWGSASGLYWYDDLSSPPFTYMAPSACPDSLALSGDEQTLFWTDTCVGVIKSMYIGSYPYGPQKVLVKDLIQPKGLAFASGKNFTGLFFVANYNVMVVDLDPMPVGLTANETKIVASAKTAGLAAPAGLAVDSCGNEKVYWSDLCTGKIQRCNFDGSDWEDVITGLQGPQGLSILCPATTATTTATTTNTTTSSSTNTTTTTTTTVTSTTSTTTTTSTATTSTITTTTVPSEGDRVGDYMYTYKNPSSPEGEWAYRPDYTTTTTSTVTSTTSNTSTSITTTTATTTTSTSITTTTRNTTSSTITSTTSTSSTTTTLTTTSTTSTRTTTTTTTSTTSTTTTTTSTTSTTTTTTSTTTTTTTNTSTSLTTITTTNTTTVTTTSSTSTSTNVSTSSLTTTTSNTTTTTTTFTTTTTTVMCSCSLPLYSMPHYDAVLSFEETASADPNIGSCTPPSTTTTTSTTTTDFNTTTTVTTMVVCEPPSTANGVFTLKPGTFGPVAVWMLQCETDYMPVPGNIAVCDVATSIVQNVPACKAEVQCQFAGPDAVKLHTVGNSVVGTTCKSPMKHGEKCKAVCSNDRVNKTSSAMNTIKCHAGSLADWSACMEGVTAEEVTKIILELTMSLAGELTEIALIKSFGASLGVAEQWIAINFIDSTRGTGRRLQEAKSYSVGLDVVVPPNAFHSDLLKQVSTFGDPDSVASVAFTSRMAASGVTVSGIVLAKPPISVQSVILRDSSGAIIKPPVKASGSASSVPGSPSSPGASPLAASSEESNSDEVVGGVVGGCVGLVLVVAIAYYLCRKPVDVKSFAEEQSV